MSNVLSRSIVIAVIILFGVAAGCLISEFPSCIAIIRDYFSPPKLPAVTIEEQKRVLTPEEQATMSGSFQKEFQLILASASGERK